MTLSVRLRWISVAALALGAAVIEVSDPTSFHGARIVIEPFPIFLLPICISRSIAMAWSTLAATLIAVGAAMYEYYNFFWVKDSHSGDMAVVGLWLTAWTVPIGLVLLLLLIAAYRLADEKPV